jgi:hypothetical protein
MRRTFAHRYAICGMILLITAGGCLVPVLEWESYKTAPARLDPVTGVRAFRVDIESHTMWETNQGSAPKSLTRQEIHQLTDIALDAAGAALKNIDTPIPVQHCEGWRFGWGVWAPFLYYHYVDVNHRVAVRLYAPERELVTLRQGQEASLLRLKPAANLAAQVAALDGLFFMGEQPATAAAVTVTTVALAPGSASAKHHEALAFGIAEYDRLTALARLQSPNDPAMLQHLEQRAKLLRDLASQ